MVLTRPGPRATQEAAGNGRCPGGSHSQSCPWACPACPELLCPHSCWTVTPQDHRTGASTTFCWQEWAGPQPMVWSAVACMPPPPDSPLRPGFPGPHPACGPGYDPEAPLCDLSQPPTPHTWQHPRPGEGDCPPVHTLLIPSWAACQPSLFLQPWPWVPGAWPGSSAGQSPHPGAVSCLQPGQPMGNQRQH